MAAFFELIKRGVPAFSPHALAAFPTAHSCATYERWMEYDFVMLARCTHLLMIAGWERSLGAQRELEWWKANKDEGNVAFSPAEMSFLIEQQPL